MFVCEQFEMTITGGRTECQRFLAGQSDPSLRMVAPFDSLPPSLRVNRAGQTPWSMGREVPRRDAPQDSDPYRIAG
jgi:hypothetical protein